MAAKKQTSASLELAEDLLCALKKDKKALAAFDRLSPSHQREYVKWINEAKREYTRARRIQSAVERVAKDSSS